MRVAAIDIGTVTSRLLIADVAAGEELTEVARSTAITNLGAGVEETGRLSGDALSRVDAAVASFVQIIAEDGVDATAAVATSAVRDATNADDFASMMRARGLEVCVLSGTDEARLSFEGATAAFSGEDLLVADIGGGSTELVLGSCVGGVRSIHEIASIDVGARRITELYLTDDPPAQLQMDAAREWARAQLAAFFGESNASPSPVTVPAKAGISESTSASGISARPSAALNISRGIALAGTATSLSAIHQELDPYDPARVQGSVLTREVVASLTHRLATLTNSQHERVAGLEPKRAAVIVGGALILGVLMELARLNSVTVSESDLLIALALAAARA